jgi:hypothetical protein
MQDQMLRYLFEARDIIRKSPSLAAVLIVYTSILWLPTALLGNSSNNWSESSSMITMVAAGLLALIVHPVIYAKYADLVMNRNQRSWSAILKTDWLNFFIVTLVLGLPLLLVEFAAALTKAQLPFPKLFVSSACALIGIYTIPLVFLLRERLSSISLGAKCLFGNFSFSKYLVLLTLVAVILGHSIESPYASIPSRLWGLLGLVLAVSLVIIDLVVFVAASLILVDKLGIRGPCMSSDNV